MTWTERAGRYVARKPPRYVPLDDDDLAGIVVRTHDVDVAIALAFAAHPDERPYPNATARTVWFRHAFCHCGGGHSGDYDYAEPGERGAFPAVEFTYLTPVAA